MEDILGFSLAGREIRHWLVAGGFVLGGWVLGVLVSLVSTKVLRRAAAKTATKFDDIVLAFVEKPLVLIVVLAGLRFGIVELGPEGAAAEWTDRIFFILVALAVAWAAVRTVDAVIDNYLAPLVAKTESSLDDQFLPVARKAINAVIWAVAILVGLTNAGYDVGALLAGLGIGGVAVALAAKDTLTNLFGGVTVFVDRPFAINDRIKVAGFDGTITEIGLRSSRLRTLDNRIVTIPNSTFGASPIENVSSEPSTKVQMFLELSHDNSPAKVEEALAILKSVAGETPGLAEGAIAAATGFGESSIRLTFIVFIAKGADYFGALSAVNLGVIKRFAEAGIAFARPSRIPVERR